MSLQRISESALTHKVLFVCLGNICRSPLAEGIFSGLVDDAGLTGDFQIDSAGTGAWHIGNPPDPRSVEIAARNGIDISHQQARTVSLDDFDRFDVIVAMDGNNLATLSSLCATPRAEIRLLLNAPPMDVPDPYFGGPEGFEDVYLLIRSGCEKLLATIR
ncbi:MAG: low molecular weight protein-tyrosine-phosphatase [Roseibium sp.]|uniref:low molecular weight protein-tyrosine-phosphatase n=1 Tax=Roseibium sp. TaxID=1936156 RepID=UPI003D9C2F49